MTDRLNSEDGKPKKVVKGKAQWSDPFAGRPLNTMTADDWCARGNAYLLHIGRAHECHWIVRNGGPVIERWSANCSGSGA